MTASSSPGGTHTAREFWSQDDLGRDYCVAITYDREDALVVWDALRRARAYVEEREHHDERYKGRFIRSYEEGVGVKYLADLEREGIVP